MNRPRVALLSVLAFLFLLIPAHAQEDFLTRGEVEEVRDAQEPGKRIELYLVIAQRRLDSIKAGITEKKPGVGRSAQKYLEEFTSILEALEDTVADGREKRAIREKDLEKAIEQETEFVTYLKSLNSESTPGYQDYYFTLEEAIEVAEEVLADAKKGAFPETEGREAPQLPAVRPTERRDPPPLPEDGPPRRRRAPSASPGDEEGPPRRSRSR